MAEDDPGVVDLETMLKGVCAKANFIDLLENFILFDDGGERMVKIVARNHQYLGVNRAIEAVRNREARAGKLGVFWQPSGGMLWRFKFRIDGRDDAGNPQRIEKKLGLGMYGSVARARSPRLHYRYDLRFADPAPLYCAASSREPDSTQIWRKPRGSGHFHDDRSVATCPMRPQP